MSPRELYAEFDAATLRRQDEQDQVMEQAWQTAVLALSAFNGKVPELKTLLKRTNYGKQTPGDQAAVVAAIASAYGLPLRKRAATA